MRAPKRPEREGKRGEKSVKDRKGKLSPAFYLAAIPLAFVSPWISSALYVLVALLWLVPDPRIERVLVKRERE